MFRALRTLRQSMISEGGTKGYLLYAAGEIFLVMVGILLALQVNNWNQVRKDRVLERQYLVELLGDLEGDRRELGENAYLASLRAMSVQAIIEAANGGEAFEGDIPAPPGSGVTFQPTAWPDSAEAFCRSQVVICISGYRVFDGSRSAFEELTASGNLRVLHNRELANILSRYYAFTESEYDADISYTRAQAFRIYDVLRKHGISNWGSSGEYGVEDLAQIVRSDDAFRVELYNIYEAALFQLFRIEQDHRPLLTEVIEQVQQRIESNTR